MNDENIVEIRCPFKKASKLDTNIYLCNRVCVKVYPGSRGEARCRSCHKSFYFQFDEQSKITTGIIVKKIES